MSHVNVRFSTRTDPLLCRSPFASGGVFGSVSRGLSGISSSGKDGELDLMDE